MKKLLLTLLSISILIQNPLIHAQGSTETITCKTQFGSPISINKGSTTIQYTKCEAINSKNESKCDELIKDSDEYKKLKNSSNETQNNKAIQDKLKAAEEEISNCKLQISENAKAEAKTTSKTYIDKLKNEINTQNCVTNDTAIKELDINCTLKQNSATNSTSEQIKSLQLLQNIFTNKFVYQMIEPLTNDNLVIQKRTCTYEFVRNKEGLLQTAPSEDQSLEDRSSSNFYQDNKFIITENKCYTSYVSQCTPNLILDNRIFLKDDLPISIYCKTYQVISGSSGTDFIKNFVNIIYNLAVGIVGVIAVIVIIVNGIKISTSGDDSGAVSEAKERIAQSIFGLAILFLAWIILRSINPNFFTDETNNIGDPRQTTQSQENNQN